MTEAKEKKQTAFENGWAVSFDEVCTVDGTACNDTKQRHKGTKQISERPYEGEKRHLLEFLLTRSLT